MPSREIENPIVNGPYDEPTRHFRFDDEGITSEIVNGRRLSAYFLPVPQPKKKGKQLVFDTEWTKDRMEECEFVNRLRIQVKKWREGRYSSATRTTQWLLDYWNNPERDKRFFFCQLEAVETAIYITEAAAKFGDSWIAEELRTENQRFNPLLDRIAFKMATGSGKTVLMAMLIAWHALNKAADPQNAKFNDAFLIVAPGITIRDRLRVLLPNDPQNYYRERDIVPSWKMDDLAKAKIVIANYHAFLPREEQSAASLTKKMLTQGGPSPFTETPDKVVRRVCRELGNKRNIVVINDEAHHCYRGKPSEDSLSPSPQAGSEERRVGAAAKQDLPTTEKLTGDERKEAEKRNKDARVWISGLEAIKQKIGIRAVYDLSATPFFLRGSGYGEGTLFPWVVSDFSLIDAIESGIVKVPRVPVADDSMVDEQPTYRELWQFIKEGLPKKNVKESQLSGPPQLPAKLQGALESLYSHYRKSYVRWEQNEEARARGQTPPVFIVVCSNTSVSKLIFDYIAGYAKPLPDLLSPGPQAGPNDRRVDHPLSPRPQAGNDHRRVGAAAKQAEILVPGALPIFSNVVDGKWSSRPNTILVDSEQLESGDAMSADFKKIAAVEIEEFKADYRARFPGRDVDKLADEDLLREVMNTVGKAGKLGENVKCVVSVSMLTEGWDANTVTHILGVRAFGTQLLCEQVVGRGLRRMSYAIGDNGKFSPEYADVYGVPFSFIAAHGSADDNEPPPLPTRVRALPDRADCAITFPRLVGYRYDIAEAELKYRFTDDSQLELSTADVPTKTENAPIVGQAVIHDLGDLQRRRESEVAFLIAKLTLEKYFRASLAAAPTRRESGVDAGAKRPSEHRFTNDVQAWRFPQLLEITREWLAGCVKCKDNTFPQLLLLIELAHDAADKIYRAIVDGDNSDPGRKILQPILQPYDAQGSTHGVDFSTIRNTYVTAANRCHISHVVADTDTWEQKVAMVLEEMEEVIRYVKNDHLGFTIPYTLNGVERAYYPDFIVHIDDGHGPDDPLQLLLECTGVKKKDKAAKVATAKTLWTPAVNNSGDWGRWDFYEARDPWNLATELRELLSLRPQAENSPLSPGAHAGSEERRPGAAAKSDDT